VHFEHPIEFLARFFLRNCLALGPWDRIALFIQLRFFLDFLSGHRLFISTKSLLVARAVPSTGSSHAWSRSRTAASTHVISVHARPVTLLFWHRKIQNSTEGTKKQIPNERWANAIEDPPEVRQRGTSNTPWTPHKLPC
jgi:hypothetical protein